MALTTRLALALTLCPTLAAAAGCECSPSSGSRRDAGARDGGSFDAATMDAPTIDAQPPDAPRPDVFIPPPLPVDVVITADNAYGFGWGDADSVDNYREGPGSTLACDIFCCPVGRGPEAYTVPAADAPDGAYLYIVAWADRSTTQGVIAQFRRGTGTPIYTGDGAWEGCATGREYLSGSPGPTQTVINEEIARCNAQRGDTTTSSHGWVGVADVVSAGAVGRVVFGEDNSDDRTTPVFENEFPIVCQDGGIDAAARWMWYSATGNYTASDDPFIFASAGAGTNPTRQFLIFRLPAAEVVGPF